MDCVKDLGGPRGEPRGTPMSGRPRASGGGGEEGSPLVVVVAVSLGVVLAPDVHHHLALGQALGVPRAHHLRVLPGIG